MEGLKEFVISIWGSTNIAGSASYIFKEKLKVLKKRIKLWREQSLGSGIQEVKEAKETMRHWDVLAEQKHLSETEASQLKVARVEYFRAEKQLSLSLKQKARVKWPVEGDENSQFFHRLIKGRLKSNTIKGLNVNRVSIEDPCRLKRKFLISSALNSVNLAQLGRNSGALDLNNFRLSKLKHCRLIF